MPETLIDLLRHGAPVGGRRYRGQRDDPLSEQGWSELWQAVGEHRPWQVIVSSPLARCRAFAEALGEKHALPFSEDARLKEVGFGVWEGRTAAELRDENPEQIKRFLNDPVGARPAGAEPLAEFCARVAAAFDDAVARHHGQHVLVVCHAGVIRAVLAHVLGLAPAALYRMQVDSAALTRIRVPGETPPVVVFHNRHSL
jgi:alpha-ribazole phosphatase/probable phosphoglycerate mutase